MRFFLQRTSDAVDTADCVQPCLLVSYRPLAQRTLRAPGAAGEMATFVAGQPRVRPGRALASGRRPAAAARRSFWAFVARAIGIALGPAGEASFPTGRTVVTGR